MARRRKKHTSCPNCGYVFSERDNFCGQCGQENHDLNVPVGHLVAEFIEHTLHLDSKSLRTLAALLFRPGLLTREFNAGKRVSFVPPVRLYVLVSVLFFFLVSIRPAWETSGRSEEKKENFTVSYYGISSAQLIDLSDRQVDSLMNAKGVSPTAFNRKIVQNLRRIAAGGREEFTHLLLKNVSYMMFILMPWFALLIYLFHRKTAEYYVGCLIHSIHFHTFLFMLFTIVLILGWVIPFTITAIPVALIIPGYFFVTLRRVYAQSVMKTLLKAAILGLLYIVSIIFCFLLAVNISLVIL